MLDEEGRGTDAPVGRSTRSDFLKRAAVAGAAATAGGAVAGLGTATGARGKAIRKAAGLHDRLNRASHWDLNVADLERSRAWYEAATPMRAVAETSADQAFPSLGIKRGRFEGCMLQDPSLGPIAPRIHLVEWKTPMPVGVAYASHANVGWNRIVMLVPDLDVARGAVVSHGTQPFLPSSDFIRPPLHPQMQPSRYRSFTAPDPEGVFIQFALSPVPRLWGVNHNTADLDRSVPFQLGLLGLDFTLGVGNPEPSPNVYGGHYELTTFEGIFMCVRGDQRVLHDHLEWADSRRFPTPYEEPTHRGIIRISIEVDDVEASYRILRASGWTRKGMVLSPPEEWDFGPPLGSRVVCNLRDPEGVRYQLIEQPPYPLAQLHPFGADLFPRGTSRGPKR